MAEVPLAEAIANLRAELQEAIAAGAGEELRFELGEVVLELDVALTASGEVKGKVSAWKVLTAEASAELARASTHRLTLTLTPRLAGAPGETVSVGDDEAEPFD